MKRRVTGFVGAGVMRQEVHKPSLNQMPHEKEN
jgi:hypothetical protein